MAKTTKFMFGTFPFQKKRVTLMLSACILSGVLTACDSNDNDESAEEINQDIIATEPTTGPLSNACLASEMPLFVTETGIEFTRTPDACFDNLPDYDFDENYLEIDGLRMHYVDAGPETGELVLMLHGQPSWSYLYRKMIPILADAGYRVIALDNVGMGKSDKPIDVSVHQYEQHVKWTKAFIEKLDLNNINLFVQDWGSLIGLRVAGDAPHRFSRITVANGDLPLFLPEQNPFEPSDFQINDSLPDADSFFDQQSEHSAFAFQEWIDYAATVPELMAGDVVQKLTTIHLTDEEVNAYNAPYPNVKYKSAIRAFPGMISGIGMQNLLAWQTLGAFHNPFMFNGAEHDKNMGREENQQKWVQHVPGADNIDHRRFDAGHFIQDDVGEDLATHFLQFLQTSEPEEPLVSGGPLFNFRYCEILLPYLNDGSVIAEVWGTPGVNFCQQSQWESIDFEAIAEEYGALSAIKNGPRFFVVDEGLNADSVGSGLPTQYRQFGQLQMRLLTTADLSISQGQAGAYQAGDVARDNTWVFKQGRRVYELIDNNANVYVMQSFSQLYDETIQINDLKHLDERLTLPQGWSFRSRILTEPLAVSSVNGIAKVLQDELGNSYQLIP